MNQVDPNNIVMEMVLIQIKSFKCSLVVEVAKKVDLGEVASREELDSPTHNVDKFIYM